MKNIAVSAENLIFSYGRKKSAGKTIRGITMNIEKGDFYALLGPNGAGKTTTMLCMLGMIKPDSGKVQIMGTEPYPGSPVFEKVAYLPEEPVYPEFLTLRETVEYYSGLYQTGERKNKADELLEKTGLSEHRNLPVGHCSKGMKQRLGIAVCLANDPEIFFLDELTRGLDPIMLMDLRSILIDLSASGKTIIMNSHMLSEVEQLCTKTAIINKGQVIREDSLSNLLKTDNDRYLVETGCFSVPDYAVLISNTADRLTVEIPVSRLSEMINTCHKSSVTVFNCRLKRQSLEDVFRQIIEEENHETDH